MDSNAPPDRVTASDPSSQHCSLLILDPAEAAIGAPAGAEGSPAALRLLPLPDGPATLRASPDGEPPSLIPASEGSLEVAAEGSLEIAAPSALFVAATGSRGEQLLLVSPPGVSTRVNGLRPPLVALLEPGDQVVVGDGPLLHASRRVSAGPVPAPASLAGRPCAVCLGPIEAEAPIVACHVCASPRHLEGEDVPADERLVCGDLGPCPECLTERPRESGLAYMPETPETPETLKTPDTPRHAPEGRA